MHTYIHIYIHTYIHTYISWIHKGVTKTVACKTGHKYSRYTNLQCKILLSCYKNSITNHRSICGVMNGKSKMRAATYSEKNLACSTLGSSSTKSALET